MVDLLKDIWAFARERKKFWLVPLIAVLLLISVLVAIAQYSTVAPFIYTLF
jgi:competence protein ComGC